MDKDTIIQEVQKQLPNPMSDEEREIVLDRFNQGDTVEEIIDFLIYW